MEQLRFTEVDSVRERRNRQATYAEITSSREPQEQSSFRKGFSNITVASAQIAHEDEDKESTTKEAILAEEECVVTGRTGEFANIKIAASTFLFPIVLFEQSDIPKFGQHYKYQIYRDSTGMRRQRFVPLGPKGDPENLKEADDLLKRSGLL